ncbi:MAG: radical SAM protein [Candidatus Omnitrophica bacterium]|nr:radical SAM protein [Candidatus Omnitrophota bacterium]
MTKPNLLLINPWIYDFAAYDFWIKPLGLLYVARFLEQYGYECELIDCIHRPSTAKDKFHTGKFPAEIIEKPEVLKHIPRYYRRYGISPQEFTERLHSIEKPYAILITSIMTYWYLGLKDAVAAVKAIFPDVPIIVSGIYPRLCPEHACKTIPADHILGVEPEINCLKILDAMSGMTRNYSEVEFDICALDHPAYHLYPSLTSASMITSVGCPLRCDYCASHLLQSVFKQRPVDVVINEIKYYKETFNIKDIAFYDDALLINPETHIKPILRKIIDQRLSINFHTPNGLHVRAIDDDMASLLFEAGFKTLRLSFESSNLERQKDSSYKVTNDEFSRVIDALKRAGFTKDEMGVYMMIGLPGQSLDEITASIEFICSHTIPIRTVQYSPIPGTKYYDRALRECQFSDSDPLLHNKSAFPLALNAQGYAAYQTLKEHIKTLNLLLK